MSRALALYETTVGKKIVMAVTGVVWFGYVFFHMLGNLLIFAGPDAINGYSAFLHDTPTLLWGARLVLVAALVGHLVAATQLALRNLDARPVPYAQRDDIATTYAARTMIWTGPILLLFLLYHIAHLTLGVAPGHPYDPHDVYGNLVRGFRNPWVVLAYASAMTALAFHLHHGAWSFFQSLGLNHPRYNHWRRPFATAMTALIVAGFLSVPIACFSGLVPLVPPEGTTPPAAHAQVEH
jgi:succinate dehydrogenase / fumarate reductase cytochrome b subunit